MNADAGIDLVRRYTAHVDSDAIGAIDTYMAKDFRANLPGMPGPIDREGFKQFASVFYTAFPDLRHNEECAVAQNGSVAMRFRLTGTHRSAFQGLAPTGRPIEVGAIAICHVADGEITELWMQMDGMSLMAQLGALPQPAGV